MERFRFVTIGAILGLLLLTGLYTLPGVAAQTATVTPTGTRTVSATVAATSTVATSPTVSTTRTATVQATRPATAAAVEFDNLPVASAVDVPSITVVGEGSVSIEPDQAVVMIGVETSSDNVLDATSEAGDTMEALLTAFQGEGINVSDIQTSGYNVWTDWGGQQVGLEGGTPTYRVSNTVRVVVRDLDNVSAVLDAAFSAGANSIQGITFTVADRTELESEARTAAVNDARMRAEELAADLDVELTAIVSVSEVVGNQVFPALRDAAMGLGGGGAGPISPGELTFSVQLQVVYAIE